MEEKLYELTKKYKELENNLKRFSITVLIFAISILWGHRKISLNNFK